MSNIKTQLKTAITSSIRNGAKITELIKKSITEEKGVSLCELATESYLDKGAKGNKFVDTLTRTIRKITSDKEWDATPPIKLALDRATKVYQIALHEPKIKEVDTLEEIVKLIEAESSTLSKEQFEIIGKALSECFTPELA
jgi:hypothetical protein